MTFNLQSYRKAALGKEFLILSNSLISNILTKALNPVLDASPIILSPFAIIPSNTISRNTSRFSPHSFPLSYFTCTHSRLFLLASTTSCLNGKFGVNALICSGGAGLLLSPSPPYAFIVGGESTALEEAGLLGVGGAPPPVWWV